MEKFSLDNKLLLNFIKLHQPIATALLLTTYAAASNDSALFIKRLYYLKSKGWLLNTGRSHNSVWSCTDQKSAAIVRVCHGSIAQADLAHEARAQPRSISFLQGSYCPPAAPPQRPGSDLSHVPSLRGSRRVPFVPGYRVF